VIPLPPPHPSERVAFNPAKDRLQQLEVDPDPKVFKKTRRKRISRWDRPPEPHDWRWVIGHIGRLLITVGLLMFGFVAYQLWGTGIQEARAQDKLRDSFQRALDEQGLTVDTLAPVSVTSTTPAPTITEPVAPGVSTTVVTSPTSVEETPSTEIEPPVTEVTAVKQELPLILPGGAIAQIRMPTIDVSKVVVAGVGVDDLRNGPGHFPNTPFPGQLGNSAIAGHRTTWGNPFLHVDELKIGDPIEITTILGDSYVYLVTGSEEVSKNDYFVITDSDPTKATLTLITCTPIGTASRRLVIHAELEVARSSDVGEPVINYGQEYEPTVDPVLPVDEPNSTVVGGSVPGVASPDVTSADASPSQVSAFGDSIDAFNQGWFADGAAWPHVAAWGAALLAVWIACYQLAKRFRRLWLGILLGIAPFVVLLYFFYENINRLLPAAI
jgi:sortase A